METLSNTIYMLNGAATTITRSSASNAMFGVQVRNAVSTFVVTGI